MSLRFVLRANLGDILFSERLEQLHLFQRVWFEKELSGSADLKFSVDSRCDCDP
jgi:hypothetical protein